MSLLKAAMTPCRRYVETDALKPDGMGGVESRYAPGAAFNAAILYDRTLWEVSGERVVPVNAHKVYVERDTVLKPGEVFERLSDGAMFVVLGDGLEDAAPAEANLSCRRFKAKRRVMPA